MNKVFVRLEDRDDIVDITQLARERLKQAITLLEKIAELKQKEDQELAEWTDHLNDISTNIDELERSIQEQ